MKIILLCIGKTASAYLQEGVQEYTQRVNNYESFELKILPVLKNANALSQQEQKQREGKALLAEIQEGDQVILLDERGRQMSSREFSVTLQKERNASRKRLVFIIGGAFGVSEDVQLRAQQKMSLSSMTLTHDMVRLLFTEQLYRAFSILAGEKYHHD